MPRRAALVTGGTSGIGYAITRKLAQDGLAVYVCSRDSAAVEQAVASFASEGLAVDGIGADVTNPADVTNLVAAAVERWGSVDVLVNNAGKNGGGVTADIDDELWNSVIETNLNSVFRTTREVLNNGKIFGSGSGRIINIASTGGKQGVAFAAPYSASKHGVIGFTKALGKELAETGVTVNAVCPGYVETPMAERVRQGYATHWGITEGAVLEKFEAKIPLGRYSTAEEVAGMVAYLAGELAGSVTAQAVNVCGGLGNY